MNNMTAGFERMNVLLLCVFTTVMIMACCVSLASCHVAIVV